MQLATQENDCGVIEVNHFEFLPEIQVSKAVLQSHLKKQIVMSELALSNAQMSTENRDYKS